MQHVDCDDPRHNRCWPELVSTPRISRGMFFPILVRSGFCPLATHMKNRAPPTVFLMPGRLACPRVFALSRRDHDRELCLHFTVGRHDHRCGFLDFRRVSSSPGLKSLMHSSGTDAPESTTNFRYSVFFEEGAGITHTSVGEWNVALSLF